MALVVICGQPCSGKSTAARCLEEALNESESKPSVRIIDEASFHLDRNHSYSDMPSEKNLRGVLRSEVDRSLSKDNNIIIVDSLNSIKGYRYELWCLARAAGTRYCVVLCDVEEPNCRKWNQERGQKGEASYNDTIFEDLARRFERPDRRNRWDSPLFELWPSKDDGSSTAAISEAVEYLTKKVDSKTRDVKILQPTIATQSARTSEANSLYEIDRATQEVINVIVEAQSQAMGGPLNGVAVGSGLPPIDICRAVGLPELRRLRRTFIKLSGQTSLSGRPPPSDADTAKRMFVDYLNRELASV